MKKLLSITLLAVSLCLTGYSQTTTNSPNPILDGPAGTVWSFLTTGSNWIVAPYAIYDTGTKNGGAGIAALVQVNQYFLSGIRFDYLNATDELWMPSVQAQLQYPIKTGRLTLTPIMTAGVATLIGGRESEDGGAVGIFGLGLAASFTKNLGVFGHYERWTGFDGNQLRGGFYWKF